MMLTPFTLQNRYEKNHIYTFVGEILLSINPFKPLPIYEDSFIRRCAYCLFLVLTLKFVIHCERVQSISCTSFIMCAFSSPPMPHGSPFFRLLSNKDMH